MTKYLMATVLLGSLLIAGCTSGPSLKSGSFKVTAPVNGVCTVSSVARISDSTVQTIRLAVRPSGTPQSATPMLSTIALVDSNGMFAPLTMGSTESPVLSGYVVSAEVWNTEAPFWTTTGPAISLVVP